MLEEVKNAVTDALQESSPGKVIVGTLLWGATHSFFALSNVQMAVLKAVGPRYRYGLYRFLYMISAVSSFGAGMIWFSRLPDRELYHVKPPLSWLMRSAQIGSIILLLESIHQTDMWRTAGITQAIQFLRGETPQPEPEAQGPLPDQRGEGMLDHGSFAHTRHPGDLSSFGLFWFFPRMTVNRMVLALLASIYSVVGAIHEESRLLAAYGEKYRRYQRQVPFMFPRINLKRKVLKKQSLAVKGVPARIGAFESITTQTTPQPESNME